MRLAEIALKCAEACEDARDITVKYGVFFAERDAQNRRGGVISDAWQCEDVFLTGWKFSLMLRDDLPCGRLQIARAAVIPEDCSKSQHIFRRRRGEAANILKGLEKSRVVRK